MQENTITTETAQETTTRTRIRRTRGTILQLLDEVRGFISANPGCSIRQIAEGLTVSAPELTLPLRRLRTDGLIIMTGTKRGARYQTA